MVIQLSLLCFVHEIDTLALAIVDAIGRNLKELRADLGKIPHYPSLCGTLRVCKQDTSSFQCHQFYIAVEKRIESNLADDRSRKRRRRNARSQENFRFVSLKRPSIANRILPFPVLQILLLCLHSHQHFPDERILNIECTSGISTAIVGCYYVLGLNVRLLLRGHEINFGEPPANIIIRESISRESCASLLHPNSQHEPLFSLASGEGDPMAGPELRRKARGFGLEIIKQLGVDGKRLKSYCRWVMHRSLDLSQMHVEMNGQDLPRKSDSEHQRCSTKWLSAESYGFTEERIIRAGTFLFDLEPIEEKSVQEDGVCLNPPFKHLLDLWILVVLLLSLARVQAEDLDHCSDLPLSTQVQQQLKNDDPSVQLLAHGNFEVFAFGLIESFDILSRFLQGPLFSGGMNKRTVLVSACGWSLYFNSINDVDPAEVFVSTLRIVRGLPSRDGLRKTRIIDGPTELLFSPSESLLLKNRGGRSVDFFPGVSFANRGRAFIGYHESDAFQVTQTFEWQYQGSISRKHLLGFREMLEICLKFSQLIPCHCDRDLHSLRDVTDIYVNQKDLWKSGLLSQDISVTRDFNCVEGQKVHTFHKQNGPVKLPETQASFNECVFSAQTSLRGKDTSQAWLFHVTNNPAARWMQICDMYPHMVGACERKSRLLLRGPGSCFHCTFDAIIPKHNQSSTYDSHDSEHPVYFVLL